MALTKIGKEGITGISNASDATAITIDASENVGIGTSSPARGLSIHKEGNQLQLTTNASGTAAGNGTDLKVDASTSDFQLLNYESANTTLWTSGTERMRIDASGNVLVGCTVPPSTSVNGAGFISGNGYELKLSNAGTTNTTRIRFFNANGEVGTIRTSGSATSYNTSSDYRLKENVDYDWDATTRLKQLKPARFNFIVDETNTLVDGFLAHEAQAIVPEAITGTKDAMTTEVLYVEGDELPDGKSVGDVKEASVPDYQGIDQSKLVPLLVKTIQELEARLTAGGL